MKIAYEWVIETVNEHGDIGDVNHADTFAGARRMAAAVAADLAPGERVEVGLVRDSGDEVDGLQDRQWAYLEDGLLPERFDGGAKVPARFHKEVKETN